MLGSILLFQVASAPVFLRHANRPRFHFLDPDNNVIKAEVIANASRTERVPMLGTVEFVYSGSSWRALCRATRIAATKECSLTPAEQVGGMDEHDAIKRRLNP